MKFYETTFDEYVHKVKETNLHPEFNTSGAFPSHSHSPSSSVPHPIPLSKFSNAIFYGPTGVGKYSQALAFLSNFSPSQLKHTRKLVIEEECTGLGTTTQRSTPSDEPMTQSNAEVDTQLTTSHSVGGIDPESTIILRMSDIHYEVNMSFLNKNARIIWHKIYSQIAEQNRECVILCKEFQAIPVDLLAVFYSYMQHNLHYEKANRIHYILLTNTTGFIPESILNMCQLVRFIRPMKKLYEQCVPQMSRHISRVKSKKDVKIDVVDVSNVKYLKVALAKFQGTSITQLHQTHTHTHTQPQVSNTTDSFAAFRQLSHRHQPTCDIILKILQAIAVKTTTSPVLFSQLREKLYDMLVFDLNIGECMWYIMGCILQLVPNPNTYGNILHELVQAITYFFRYYDQHYRPIYHLEHVCMKFVRILTMF